jgi:membrane-bound lytic murein transglycosylase D
LRRSIRKGPEGIRIEEAMKQFFIVFLFVLLLSCAAEQKKPLKQVEAAAPPKANPAMILAEKISGVLDRIDQAGLPPDTRTELSLEMESLLGEYLALAPDDQKDPRLQGSIERLLDVSRDAALTKNIAPEAVSGEEQPSPKDELLNVTTFLSPDELMSTLEEVKKAKDKIDLGIQIPLDNPAVLTYVRLYQTKLKRWFGDSLERGAPYVPEMKKIFKDEGVPPELVYLGIVESAFKPNARSRAKALGMWQFMEGTAKNYGIIVDFWQDERLDPWRSARGSAKYLGFLHSLFNDWNIALASYNCGEGKALRYLARHPGKDYWELRNAKLFRRETKEYVPAILAAILIASDPQAFGMEIHDPPACDQSAAIALNQPVDLRVLARHLQIPVEVILSLNPSLKRAITPPRVYELRVPADKFEAADFFISDYSGKNKINYVVHDIRKGETIKSIAKKYNSDPVEIQNLNLGISGRLRSKTKILVIPGDGANPAESAQKGNIGHVIDSSVKQTGTAENPQESHIVQKGDTLGKIAGRYDTTVEELCKINHLTPRSMLHIGMKIKIP